MPLTLSCCGSAMDGEGARRLAGSNSPVAAVAIGEDEERSADPVVEGEGAFASSVRGTLSECSSTGDSAPTLVGIGLCLCGELPDILE
jgi:hypothetical protein